MNESVQINPIYVIATPSPQEENAEITTSPQEENAQIITSTSPTSLLTPSESQLQFIEDRQDQPDFQPNLSMEINQEERTYVLERLDLLCKQVSHNRRVRIVRMWHGCNRETLPYLLSNGFATLGKIDDGWYGRAMYFTSSAKYALRYGNCLIMCYILLLNPFPVVTNDAPHGASPTTFRFYGRGNYKNYQCHYIPVAPTDRDPTTTDYRPPTNGIDGALYDELAVFQEINILPQVVVHFK
ncbi:unnamed protein product [Didymodactylos carnosus]|uniref:PARP n=1 Tax=Didymodactylos carnosus TaxID=1234261 RepID=A0A815C0F3_9BILA|nr:unnamed protein product [Didymodactylos carnosus]CAF1276751.1 unnamed protein product [Didymodactylos carnosus]CAF3748130.1 unnamed protein product [Didymodactylos carnosus]CAF4068807.1 unnamed protein product [Didymodactylos carnosus]